MKPAEFCVLVGRVFSENNLWSRYREKHWFSQHHQRWRTGNRCVHPRARLVKPAEFCVLVGRVISENILWSRYREKHWEGTCAFLWTYRDRDRGILVSELRIDTKSTTNRRVMLVMNGRRFICGHRSFRTELESYKWRTEPMTDFDLVEFKLRYTA